MSSIQRLPRNHFVGTKAYYDRMWAAIEREQKCEERRKWSEFKLRQRRLAHVRAIRDQIRSLDESMKPTTPSLGVLSGIAIPFEVFGYPNNDQVELIGPNALDDLLAGSQNVPLLRDHDAETTLATRAEFTLRLSKTEDGLRIEADIPDTIDGQLIAVSGSAGTLTGFSFRIDFANSIFSDAKSNGATVLYFRKLAIAEISIITAPRIPAFPLVKPIQWKPR